MDHPCAKCSYKHAQSKCRGCLKPKLDAALRENAKLKAENERLKLSVNGLLPHSCLHCHGSGSYRKDGANKVDVICVSDNLTADHVGENIPHGKVPVWCPLLLRAVARGAKRKAEKGGT